MLCFSTGSLPDLSFTRISLILENTPFRGIELVVTPGMLARWDDAPYWESVRKEFATRGQSFRNIHLGNPYLMGPHPHHPGLAVSNLELRERKLQTALRCLRIAESLHSPHLTLTTGIPEAEVPLSNQEHILWTSLERILEAKGPRPQILIEQEPEHIISTTAQLLGLSEKSQGAIGATFDIGHAEVVGEDIPACIRALGNNIHNLHFEDIEGRVHKHKLFGEGNIGFAPIFEALKAVEYAGDYTPDLYPFKDEYERALTASADFFGKYL